MSAPMLTAEDIAAERSTCPKLYLRNGVWWTRVHGRRVSTKCLDRDAAEVAARRLELTEASNRHLRHVPAGFTRGGLDMRFAHLPNGEGVYFLHAFTVGLVKIGCAHQLRLRVQGLALANAAPIACRGYLCLRQLRLCGRPRGRIKNI